MKFGMMFANVGPFTQNWEADDEEGIFPFHLDGTGLLGLSNNFP